jgi:hypothetical protein
MQRCDVPPLSFDLWHNAHVQYTSYWISFSNWILFYDLTAPLHKVYHQWVPQDTCAA